MAAAAGRGGVLEKLRGSEGRPPWREPREQTLVDQASRTTLLVAREYF